MEDDEPMCWLLEVILKDDFDVTFMQDGLSGMKWLSEGNVPSLILCDFVLPKINGFDFLSSLSKSGVFSEIPVVMFSSRTDEGFKKRCLEAGASGYLEKPFDPPQLLNIIDEVLNNTIKSSK